jgi:hypothetical protein
MGKKKTKNQSNTKMQLEYIVLIGKFSDGDKKILQHLPFLTIGF